MSARYLVSNPCADACGTVRAGRDVEGAPVFRCPGCDSEWVESSDLQDSPADAVRPRIAQTVLDARDVRALAEFYRRLFGLTYREGDEPPAGGPDDADWLVLRNPDGVQLAFQQNAEHVRPTWPHPRVPQQLHLDCTVPDVDALAAARDRALVLGATLLLDKSADAEEPLYVFADPAGHPFCIFVS